MSEVFAEPVTGHRSWALDVEGMNLEAAFGPWLTGFMEAVCHRYGHESPHWPEPEPPDLSTLSGLIFDERRRCMCGINAYKLHMPLDAYPPQRADDGTPLTQVVGIVDLGGRVHEYEHGYRAQYGRLAEATVISRVPYGSRFTTYLADKYEAPFRVMTWSDYRNEWELTHGRDWQAEEEDNDAEAGAETQASTQAGAGQGARAGGPVSALVGSTSGVTRSIQVKLQANAAAFQRQLYSAWSGTVTPAVEPIPVGGKWQPALSDGRRLYRYLSLAPEWRMPDRTFPNHKPVLRRSHKAAMRKGRGIQEGNWWARQTPTDFMLLGLEGVMCVLVVLAFAMIALAFAGVLS